jgi:glycolate oxidase FAD binding subunit
VITQATFRLHPLPLHTRTLTLRAADPDGAQQLMLAIQDSQLAHVALQARLTAGDHAEIDILFEGTPAGLAAQEGAWRELAGDAPVSSGPRGVWDARQELWSHDTAADVDAALAKLSVLPADLAGTIGIIAEAAATFGVGWSAVLQATGLGLVRLDGVPPSIHATLRELRSGVERRDGSLVVLRQPAGEAQMDAWGRPGDALPLMRALKQQLDPHGTLNPGRFVGGV